MDFVKNYMISALSEASKKLRLNPEKVEVLHRVEEWIGKRENLGEDIAILKRITETSRLAIRLQDINNYLNFEKIDYKKFSEKFLEHCNFLVTDLEFLLLNVNQSTIRKILERVETIKDYKAEYPNLHIKIELDQTNEIGPSAYTHAGKRRSMKIDPVVEPELPLVHTEPARIGKRALIEKEKDFLYGPIKDLEELIRRMGKEDFRSSEVFKFSDIFSERVKFCKKNGLDELLPAYENITMALRYIYNKEMHVSRDVIELFRAAMIVIVSEVRGLQHDIAEYKLRNQIFTETLKVYKKDKK